MESDFRQKYIWLKKRLSVLLGGVPEDNCEELRDYLSAYLDGELSEREKTAVETHLAKCESCRTELAALKLTTVFFAARPKASLSADKSAQLHFALEEAMRERSHFPLFGRQAWAFSGAAFAAVFAFGFLYLSHNGAHQGVSAGPNVAYLPPQAPDSGGPLVPSLPIYPVSDDGSVHPSAVSSGRAAALSPQEETVISSARPDDRKVFISHSGGQLARGGIIAPPSSNIRIPSKIALAPGSSPSDGSIHPAIMTQTGSVAIPPAVSNIKTAPAQMASVPPPAVSPAARPVAMVAETQSGSSSDSAQSQTISLGHRLRNAGQAIELHTANFAMERRQDYGDGTANIVDAGFH